MDNLTIGQQMRIAHQAIHQHIDRKLSALELTGIQSFVLRCLSERSGEVVYPRDIEKQFHLTHPTVSGILQRLESKGFISILPDPDDRRCHRIALTDKGLRCQQDIQAHIDAMEQAMTSGMTDAEQAQLHDLLARLTDNLTELRRRGDAL